MRLLMIVALLGASLSFDAVNGAEAGCDASGGLEFVCGITNGEDLVRVPNTPWLIVSGFAADAGISMIDSRNGSHAKLYPDERSRVRHDARFADCTTPPSTATWVTHGLHLRPGSDGHSTLYVVGHGSREAIEVFDVDANASGAGNALDDVDRLRADARWVRGEQRRGVRRRFPRGDRVADARHGVR